MQCYTLNFARSGLPLLAFPASYVVHEMPDIGSELTETCRVAYYRGYEMCFDTIVNAVIDPRRSECINPEYRSVTFLSQAIHFK
jgi:hypothetical protein